MSDIIWGATRIGQEAGIIDERGEVDLRKTFYQLETGHLPARKIGRQWVSSISAIQRALQIEA
jgi:hypothetical protein